MTTGTKALLPPVVVPQVMPVVAVFQLINPGAIGGRR